MKELEKKLKIAREVLNHCTFGTQEWDAAFSNVREITQEMTRVAPKQEFFSIDSGIHRTRLLDGRII